MPHVRVVIAALLLLLCCALESPAQREAKIGKSLKRSYPLMNSQDEALVLISFTERGLNTLALPPPQSFLSERALARRMKVRPALNLVDEEDMPLNQAYVRTVAEHVRTLRHQLKWFNAVSALASKKQIDTVRTFPFVKEIELVARRPGIGHEGEKRSSAQIPNPALTASDPPLDYGPSYRQDQIINVPEVHLLGMHGQGVMVAVFDDGMRLLGHEAFSRMDVCAMYDFVDNKVSVVPNDATSGWHGVVVLASVAGFAPGKLIGTSFQSTYVLARTEIDSVEIPSEEDNYVKALEWAESLGVDIVSSSLTFMNNDPPYPSYTWEDMDGNTALSTRAADRAVSLGVFVVNGAGNSGWNPTHNTLVPIADGDSVLGVGAVDSTGARAWFSSVGPTVDGRTKPDVMTMGQDVFTADYVDPHGYIRISGTSLAGPQAAGVAALVLSAHPHLTPMEVMAALRETATNASSPNNLTGWGMLDALSAVSYWGISSNARGRVFFDLNRNGLRDSGEAGCPGVTVRLTGDGATDSTLTGPNGNYLLEDLPLGDITITVTPPRGWRILVPAASHHHITNGYPVRYHAGQDFALVRQPLYDVRGGWNLVSLPEALEDRSVRSAYPDAVSKAYTYSGEYVQTDTLPAGRGYWLKFAGPREIGFAGEPRLSDTLEVVPGWNIIGSLSEPIDAAAVASLPEDLVRSDFYEYSSVYRTSPVIAPGKGYWVYVDRAGKLLLSSHVAHPYRGMTTAAWGLPPQPPPDVSDVSEAAQAYYVSQVYPSPFNPTAGIEYHLPAESWVRLTVYDMLGREVAVLVDGIQSAGWRHARWNASRFTSGIYFFRLEASSTSASGKAVREVRKAALVR